MGYASALFGLNGRGTSNGIAQTDEEGFFFEPIAEQTISATPIPINDPNVIKPCVTV
jgi:hypothetical protein